ncbi:MAG: hypothetical protein DIU79_12275 [Actinobacteria bacterium]|nr:MAG: hypothetical protein DIU79_12275 [Actinomycetota bacterium]
MRFRSFAGTATVWEWRADDDNALALTVTPTDIAFTRTTDGADDTVTVPRPAGQSNDGSDELVAFATWDEGRLTLRIHDGTDWGAVQTTTSTDWPDLRGADWHLGARWKDNGTQDQYLWGHLVWCVVGTNPDAIDPTAIPALTGEEPTPDDIPDVAGLAWLWATTNPGRLIVWREGGYATVAGEVTAWDRPTALVIIGEDAARGHHIGPARLTVRAIPRLRYLGGA